MQKEYCATELRLSMKKTLPRQARLQSPGDSLVQTSDEDVGLEYGIYLLFRHGQTPEVTI